MATLHSAANVMVHGWSGWCLGPDSPARLLPGDDCLRHSAQCAWQLCRAAAEHEALEQQHTKRAKVDHVTGSRWSAGLSHSAPQPADLALWADGDPPEPAGSSSVPKDSRGGSAAAMDTKGAATGAGDDWTEPAASDAAAGRICQAGSGLWQQGPPQDTVLSQQVGLPQQQGQAGGISAAAHQVLRLQPAQSQAAPTLSPEAAKGWPGASAGALQSFEPEAQGAGCVRGRMYSSGGHILQAGRSAEACHPSPATHSSDAAQKPSAASMQSQPMRRQQQPSHKSTQAGRPAAVARVLAGNPGSHAGVCCCSEARCLGPACSQSVLSTEALSSLHQVS